MAFELGESASAKLPPIRKQSVKGTNSRSSDNNAASSHPCLHRQQHGLVRLPPIERMQLTAPQSFDERDSYPGESDGGWGITHTACGKSDRETSEVINPAARCSRFSSTTSSVDNHEERSGYFPDGKSRIHRGIDLSSRGESTSSGQRGSRASLTTTRKTSLSSLSHRKSPKGEEKTELLYRKLSLAKSSPDLSRPCKVHTSSPSIITGKTELSSPRRSSAVVDTSTAVLLKSSAENNGDRQTPSSVKQSKQRIPRIEGTAKQRAKAKKQLTVAKTHSNPASPVCNQPAQTSKTQGRKSLSDIQGLALPCHSRRPSLEPVKTQNLMTDDPLTNLAVHGKTCRQNERRPSRSLSNQHLAPPQNACTSKRDSLYDLSQILGILNQEKADAERTTQPENSAGNIPATSVYDLREFLSLALAEELRKDATERAQKSSELLPQAPAGGASGSGQTGLNVSDSDANRRASAYDLMEFLTLGLSLKPSEQTPGQSSSSPAVGPEAEQQEKRTANLEIPGNAESARRGSTYDLMEFLSLRASPAPQSPREPSSPSLAAKPSPEPDKGYAKERRLSLYDLQEFLAMHSASSTSHGASQGSVNLAVPSIKTPKPEASNETGMKRHPTNTNPIIVEGEAIEGERHENRQFSVYDLREFLKLYSSSRKPSSISQSAVAIYITDEPKPGSKEEVSLPMSPQQGSAETSQRKASMYDLAEFLSALEQDNSPLRRRMSSVSGASDDQEIRRPSISSRSDSGGSGSFLCVTGAALPTRSPSELSRSRFLPRQDSVGNRSLYDLHEFLSLINSEDALPGRRFERGKLSSPCSPSQQDAKFVDELEEGKEVNIDTAKAESQKRPDVDKDVANEINEDICIEVPTLLPKATEKPLPDRLSIKNRLAALRSVPEATDNWTIDRPRTSIFLTQETVFEGTKEWFVLEKIWTRITEKSDICKWKNWINLSFWQHASLFGPFPWQPSGSRNQRQEMGCHNYSSLVQISVILIFVPIARPLMPCKKKKSLSEVRSGRLKAVTNWVGSGRIFL